MWAPVVQVLMGSPRKLSTVHTSEFSCQGGEREVFITNSYEAWMGPAGGRRLPSAKAERAGTTRESPWRWVFRALLPPESDLRAGVSGKVSDFIPPQGRHGLVKRGSPTSEGCT